MTGSKALRIWIAMVGGLAAAAMAQERPMFPMPRYDVGAEDRASSGPERLAAGDFDGDGDMDFAAANDGTGDVRLMLNMGTGVFEAGSRFTFASPTSSRLDEIAAVDLDADGDLDLLVVDGPALHTLSNDGLGGFTPGPTTDLPDRAFAFAAFDATGDGIPDALVGTVGLAEAVYLAVGLGDGAFELSEPTPVPDREGGFGVVDADGYGDLDVLYTRWRPEGVHGMLVNDGAGGWTLRDVHGLPDARYWAIGDLDGDGDADAVQTGRYIDTGAVLLNDGAGGFALQTDVFPVTGSVLPKLADLDGDGVLDLLCGPEVNPFRNSFAVRLGEGDGRFADAVTYEVEAYHADHLIIDADGDGDLDVIAGDSDVSSFDRAYVVLLANAGEGAFAARESFEATEVVKTIAVGDVDGDGFEDVLTLHDEADRFDVHLGDGLGGFVLLASVTTPGRPGHIELGDMDGDGDLDAVVCGLDTNVMVVFRNDGAGAFAPRAILPVGSQPGTFALGDLDGDGDLDVAVGARSTGRVYVLRNDGTGNLASVGSHSVASSVSAIAIADMDGDGQKDLVVEAGRVQVLLNEGDAVFGRHIELPVSLTRGLAVGDVDGDGRPDIFSATSSLSILPNASAAGVLAFGDVVTLESISIIDPGTRAIADIDGDGIADLVSGGLDVHLGRGGFQFAPRKRFASRGWESLVVRDVNRDGAQDLLHIAGGFDGVGVMLNQRGAAPCRADLDGDGELTIFDFLAFQNAFDTMDPVADFDGDGAFTIFDFLAFQNAFDAGC